MKAILFWVESKYEGLAQNTDFSEMGTLTFLLDACLQSCITSNPVQLKVKTTNYGESRTKPLRNCSMTIT